MVWRAGERARGVRLGVELVVVNDTASVCGSVFVVSANEKLVLSRGRKPGFLKVLSELSCLELHVRVLLQCGRERWEKSLVFVILSKSKPKSWSKIRSSATEC